MQQKNILRALVMLSILNQANASEEPSQNYSTHNDPQKKLKKLIKTKEEEIASLKSEEEASTLKKTSLSQNKNNRDKSKTIEKIKKIKSALELQIGKSKEKFRREQEQHVNQLTQPQTIKEELSEESIEKSTEKKPLLIKTNIKTAHNDLQESPQKSETPKKTGKKNKNKKNKNKKNKQPTTQIVEEKPEIREPETTEIRETETTEIRETETTEIRAPKKEEQKNIFSKNNQPTKENRIMEAVKEWQGAVKEWQGKEKLKKQITLSAQKKIIAIAKEKTILKQKNEILFSFGLIINNGSPEDLIVINEYSDEIIILLEEVLAEEQTPLNQEYRVIASTILLLIKTPTDITEDTIKKVTLSIYYEDKKYSFFLGKSNEIINLIKKTNVKISLDVFEIFNMK